MNFFADSSPQEIKSASPRHPTLYMASLPAKCPAPIEGNTISDVAAPSATSSPHFPQLNLPWIPLLNAFNKPRMKEGYILFKEWPHLLNHLQ